MLAILPFLGLCAQPCSSLATETGETTSLWDALAWHNGVDPASWTISEFRAEAQAFAQFHGLVYDKSAKGNLAILHHINCLDTAVHTSGDTTFVASSDDQWASWVIDTVVQMYASSNIVIETAQLATVATQPLTLEETRIETLTHVAIDPICTECDLTGSIAEIWGRYMSLCPARIADSLGIKWSSLDRYTKAQLTQCRHALGSICRPHHALKPIETDGPAQPVVKVHVRKQPGLAKAKAKRFWRSVGLWFRSFGACKRASRG